MIFRSLFVDYIDKVFVFYAADGSISFVLPWLNFDYIYISILVCLTIVFIFDVVFIFINQKGKKYVS